MQKASLATFSFLFAVVATPSLASADDFVCRRAVGSVTLDNVVVPNDATCTLTGTRVEGNIVVKSRATLNATAVRVDGNIQAEGAKFVGVYPGDRASRVGGSVQIVQGGGAKIKRVVIGGDLQFFSNRNFLKAVYNHIDGNLQAVSNTGGLQIARNVIEGALQCKQNDPPPTGGLNDAGDKEDQCRRL